jgi:hypothetical protein
MLTTCAQAMSFLRLEGHKGLDILLAGSQRTPARYHCAAGVISLNGGSWGTPSPLSESILADNRTLTRLIGSNLSLEVTTNRRDQIVASASTNSLDHKHCAGCLLYHSVGGTAD